MYPVKTPISFFNKKKTKCQLIFNKTSFCHTRITQNRPIWHKKPTGIGIDV